ncbi:MAG: 4Fe-4S dicluster domain-containing protein [Thermoleophilia bacterium]
MSSSSRTFSAEILATTGINAATCYQCGKCSAGCPMASESDLRPHNIMRLVIQGRREQALADETIWLCLTCETCSARCPNGCDPARVIDAVRELSLEEGSATQPRRIAAFHRAFLSRIRATGRLHEVGMVVDYKLRSGDFMSDVTNAPAMLTRGKLSLRAERIDGVDEMKRMFAKCGVTL